MVNTNDVPNRKGSISWTLKFNDQFVSMFQFNHRIVAPAALRLDHKGGCNIAVFSELVDNRDNCKVNNVK